MPSTSAIKLPITAFVFTAKYQLGITVVPDKMKPQMLKSSYWRPQPSVLAMQRVEPMHL